MKTLDKIAISQTARCKQQPLSIQRFSELNAEKSRVKAELDCLRGLEPQESNAFYLTAYGKMYERLERTAYLARIVS